MQSTESEIQSTEREKYKDCWVSGEYPASKLQIVPPFLFTADDLKRGGAWLDVGCGNGSLVAWLRSKGVEAYGVDITSAAWESRSSVNPRVVMSRDGLYQAPMWDLPFDDNAFSVTTSITVLEHLPLSLVHRSLQEIVRVTRPSGLSKHWMSCLRREEFRGYDLHTALFSVGWWRATFKELGADKFRLVLEEKDDALRRHKAHDHT